MRIISIDFSWQIRLIADMAKTPIENMKPILDASDQLLDTAETAKMVVFVRVQMGVSQKALAIEMGINQSYLCDLEKGKRRWSLALFNSAKDALQRILFPAKTK